jgi:hypothetical protein
VTFFYFPKLTLEINLIKPDSKFNPLNFSALYKKIITRAHRQQDFQ